jgi:hypothetical protein
MENCPHMESKKLTWMYFFLLVTANSVLAIILFKQTLAFNEFLGGLLPIALSSLYAFVEFEERVIGYPVRIDSSK